LLEAVTGSARFTGARDATGSEHHLQAAGARALVALAHDDDESRVELHRIACDVASVLRSPKIANSETRAGLSFASLQRVHALINERLEGDAVAMPRISELAEAAGLSRYHFIRKFHRSVGLTPYAWVAACRLERSLALILQGDGRIDDIGERLGFSSPSHFVGSFRKRFGVTPGSLRNAVTPP
jgi:AraC family transcriptional regulator